MAVLFIEIIGILVLVWGVMFYQVTVKIWFPVLGIATFVLLFTLSNNWVVTLLLWFVSVLVMFLVSYPPLRLRLLTPLILNYFQRVLPPISVAEQEAIIAGDAWWERALFCGNPNWQQLLIQPKLALTETEQTFLDQQVEHLCELIDDWAIVSQGNLPAVVWDYIKHQGFLGLTIGSSYGGHGFSEFAHSNIITKIASRSVSVAITVMVPNTLGTGQFLSLYGTDEQKHYYLPRLTRGIEISAFALTSSVAGSDASSILDKGVICRGNYAGEEVIGIRLSWDKRYITLAPIATLLGLAVKLYDPERLLGDKQNLGITLCVVPTHLPGVEIGARHMPAGLAFLNGPTRGHDVFISLNCIIGGPSMCGRGWAMMMECLAGGRGISLPALSTGMAKLCYRTTGAYAQVREQFNVAIGQFEGVAELLGRIGGLTYLCEATRCFTLSGIEQGFRPALAAAITKYHLTEMGRIIVNDAMDIHAGRGIQLGPRNYLGLLQQAVPISITVEGANILTRNLIIFGQGAMRCHPFIAAEMAASRVQDPQQRLQQFDPLLWQHISYTLKNGARVLAYGLSGGVLIRVPAQGKATPYLRQFTRMSAALAFTTDLIMAILGGKLKRNECLSSRLGDVLSQLYLASAVIKYYHDQDQSLEDVALLRWTLEKCLWEIQLAFDAVFKNFKPRWLGWIVARIIFPWGRAYRPSNDTLTAKIAADMMKTSPQRDRLTAYCYIGKTSQSPVRMMDDALQAVEQASMARSKLKAVLAQIMAPPDLSLLQQIAMAESTGLLSLHEIELLQRFAHLREDAVKVDEF